jgi:hypothetical protein
VKRLQRVESVQKTYIVDEQLAVFVRLELVRVQGLLDLAEVLNRLCVGGRFMRFEAITTSTAKNCLCNRTRNVPGLSGGPLSAPPASPGSIEINVWTAHML